MLGSRVNTDGSLTQALALEPAERILQRTQHILIPPDQGNAFAIPTTDDEWRDWHNLEEYDRTTIKQWLDLPLGTKIDALSVILGVKVNEPTVDPNAWGCQYDPNQPDQYVQTVLCRGVGHLTIQGWYETSDVNALSPRWVPDDDPDDDGDHADSELLLQGGNDDLEPGVLYPFSDERGYGAVRLGGPFKDRTFTSVLNADHFNVIPGLGRALKFTFTLYDSQGLIPNGRVFTHIVYLDQ
jgi:hypothetical protein